MTSMTTRFGSTALRTAPLAARCCPRRRPGGWRTPERCQHCRHTNISPLDCPAYQGLHWVLEYYYKGVASWDWYYPYYYAPMASDLTDLADVRVRWGLGDWGNNGLWGSDHHQRAGTTALLRTVVAVVYKPGAELRLVWSSEVPCTALKCLATGRTDMYSTVTVYYSDCRLMTA